MSDRDVILPSRMLSNEDRLLWYSGLLQGIALRDQLDTPARLQLRECAAFLAELGDFEYAMSHPVKSI